MSDIGVYTSPLVLAHKCAENSPVEEVEALCYWRLRQTPQVSAGDRIWFAARGAWRGWFEVEQIEEGIKQGGKFGCDVVFWRSTWHDEKRGSRSPFRGFTYRVPARRSG